MDDPRFSICAITTPKWDLGQCVDGWARHGVPAIGVTRVGLNEYGRQEGIRRLKDSGLRVTDYQGIGRYGHDYPRIGEAIDSFMGDLDAAAELGVDCVFVMSGPRDAAPWEEAAKRFTEELRLLLPHAKERGLRLAIEPIHPMRQDLTFVNTARTPMTSSPKSATRTWATSSTSGTCGSRRTSRTRSGGRRRRSSTSKSATTRR